MDSYKAYAPPRSAYIHIPFCHRRCFYCDFAIVPLGDNANSEVGQVGDFVDTYLKILEEEIELSPLGPPLSTIYIGGGTPSILCSRQIGSLLTSLKAKYGFQDGYELTLEMDPATFNYEDLLKFIELGINRISLGAQSFDDLVLASIGRVHKRKNVIEACYWLNQLYRQGKLRTWNMDLIQNLPGQTLLDWENQLYMAVKSFVPHLSIYDLSIEPGTLFELKHSRGELPLPDEELSSLIFNSTSKILAAEGFTRYEISNYSIPGHQSRHNRVYWSGAGWWGFGQSATSSPWGQRFTRPRSSADYASWVKKLKKEGLHFSLDYEKALPMPLDEMIMVGLRCREGIDLEKLAIRFGWNKSQRDQYLSSLLHKWKTAIERGWLLCKGSRLKLSDPEGMIFSNQVLIDLMVWWDSLPSHVVDVSIPSMHL